MCVACSGPYVDIDMRSGEMDGYDAVFLSPHKFVGGPGTPGILLMNRALYRLAGMPPSTCGGGTVAYVNGFSEEVRPNPPCASSYSTATVLICSCMQIPNWALPTMHLIYSGIYALQ